MKILIGDNIRRLRRQGSITQEQLAEMLGVTCAAVSKWERGETYPDITLLFPLAHFFQVTVDELMGFDEDLLEREIDAVAEIRRSLPRQCLKSAGIHYTSLRSISE